MRVEPSLNVICSAYLDAVAAGEEDHNLLLEVFLEKGKEEQKAAVRRTDDVALLNVVGRGDIIVIVHTNIQRLALGLERQRCRRT